MYRLHRQMSGDETERRKNAYGDTLTITTNAAGDSPHNVSLVMQPRGVVIANTAANTNWAFGTITFGSIGTITDAIQNNGNAPAQTALNGVLQPTIFALASTPAT